MFNGWINCKWQFSIANCKKLPESILPEMFIHPLFILIYIYDVLEVRPTDQNWGITLR